ncbi:hypothetical protein EH223_07920 [candidate division KSB1 bacterium]|nr:hypothetical protein [candidate division KSB1 bacterium]RQW04119.1 MAG: hypothetical protein EH223_07920 [candidate division KSB1 bacterium]
MADFFKTSIEKDKSSLGRQLVSWVYKPKKSNRFVFYILGLVGALALFIVMYGSRFLPWLEKLPDALIYVLFLAIGPVLNFFKSLGKTQEWTLYERGFVVKYMNQGKGTGDERFEAWHHYKSCTYEGNSVTLLPAHQLKRKVKMRTAMNAIEIYSICRERISIAQAEVLHHQVRTVKTPDTPEQRRMAQLEKRYSKRSQDFNWKDIFQG